MADTGENLELLLENVDQVADPQRGDLLRGNLLSITPQGLIIDLGLKRDGFVPRDDLDRLPDGEFKFKVGDEIAVMVVIPLDRDGNLVVSVSQARESGDWLEAHRLMETDAILEATPSAHNRGGLIVPFGRLRGFVPASHLSDLPRGLDEESRTNNLQKLVGRRMPFKVIEVDPQRQRLVLSERKAIRQWRQDQKSRVIKSLSEGEVRRGTVTSLREFGAFVDIGGADGLIHISELSWSRVEDPSEILTVGDEVEAKIIRLDAEANRIGLSLKRLQPNPWLEAVERISAGMIMEGEVTRIGSSGAYIRDEAGLEGLVRGAEAQTELEPGMHVRVRVVNLDSERERLDLEIALEDEASVPQ
ncbi:MAG TPA: S1 RNA-binding domain-containing protein [Anaerolineales bacterium]|jgi:small subunit ribosomal protein S1|nr:S1 RNA-binding domain-containing protein [Anaerolineales bacterium]